MHPSCRQPEERLLAFRLAPLKRIIVPIYALLQQA
jgi:hypothetical protein